MGEKGLPPLCKSVAPLDKKKSRGWRKKEPRERIGALKSEMTGGGEPDVLCRSRKKKEEAPCTLDEKPRVSDSPHRGGRGRELSPP